MYATGRGNTKKSVAAKQDKKNKEGKVNQYLVIREVILCTGCSYIAIFGIFYFYVFLLTRVPAPASILLEQGEPVAYTPIYIYLFWGGGCPGSYLDKS